ncbi:hypothetical protein CY34DRAFT_586004 [Suillus luteus UH-Slu-Lm8-n1]|uniref:Uncharacterized protein n=1 Tax=Suillus luteus UH-Slu-Lm8-n1 TaxID=930992 RepID=A0A0D0BP58_9AGAM|nr:hypothetical protein CY34DRAFT_586004 [Suillus luteus UH-Slu-Lm8-n1]
MNLGEILGCFVADRQISTLVPVGRQVTFTNMLLGHLGPWSPASRSMHSIMYQFDRALVIHVHSPESNIIVSLLEHIFLKLW